jgi:CO dehydrogenase maturation factor
VGDHLLTWIGRSAFVKSAERGTPRPLSDLEPANVLALAALRDAVDSCAKDWARYTAQAHQFHLRNALAWGNAKTGEDLASQIDPDYVLGLTEPRKDDSHVT